MTQQIVEQALKYWNVRRGYQVDGSEFPDGVSLDTIDDHEAAQYVKLSGLLKEEWLRRGNPLHPKNVPATEQSSQPDP